MVVDVLASGAGLHALAPIENIRGDASETDIRKCACEAGEFASLTHHSHTIGMQASAINKAVLVLEIK